MVPDFFPFPGLRYRPDALGASLDELIAPPYDVIDAEARARLEATHPQNVVHVILPRDEVPGDGYRRAAARFRQWQAEGVLATDPPRFYIYSMTFTDGGGRRRLTAGVVGALALSPPGEGSVLPHERTMPKPRSDRLALLREVRANLDPVWCLSLASGLTALLRPHGPPEAECVDEDGVEHRLYPLGDDLAPAVSAAVAAAPAVIADGHHRYETALAFSAEDPRAGRIMALVVELAEEQLEVRAIHRLLGGVGPEFRRRLAGCATVDPAGPNTPDGVRELLRRMEKSMAMGLVDSGGLALLTLRPGAVDLEHLPASLREVDAARLEVALAATGATGDLDYLHDPLAVAAMVAKGAADAAVLLRPVSVSQIQTVATAGERMPEKTTFFSPKPRTGMVFRLLDA